MGLLGTAFSRLAITMTGDVIRQIDTPIMDGRCQMSLRLKRKGEEMDAYVVVADIASGNYQYYPMKSEEFLRFADAVQTTKTHLTAVNHTLRGPSLSISYATIRQSRPQAAANSPLARTLSIRNRGRTVVRVRRRQRTFAVKFVAHSNRHPWGVTASNRQLTLSRPPHRCRIDR
jgi:hypothetical protein